MGVSVSVFVLLQGMPLLSRLSSSGYKGASSADGSVTGPDYLDLPQDHYSMFELLAILSCGAKIMGRLPLAKSRRYILHVYHGMSLQYM